jgi:bacterioferritin
VQGSPRILKLLGDLLAAELAAVNTYFVDGKLRADWGYPELAKKAYDESMGEMRHAERLIERIIYFDDVPNLQRLGRVKAGATVTEQFENELEIERGTVTALVEGIQLCREDGDDGTRLLLEPMLADGESAIDWLETQLGLVARHGEATYLAEYIRGE